MGENRFFPRELHGEARVEHQLRGRDGHAPGMARREPALRRMSDQPAPGSRQSRTDPYGAAAARGIEDAEPASTAPAVSVFSASALDAQDAPPRPTGHGSGRFANFMTEDAGLDEAPQPRSRPSLFSSLSTVGAQAARTAGDGLARLHPRRAASPDVTDAWLHPHYPLKPAPGLPAAMPEQPAFDSFPSTAPAFLDADPDDLRSAVRPMQDQVRKVAQGLGAVLSIGLLIFSGNWVWQMMQRDVSGVPVVRALEGPVRVTPEDPGGRQAAHQGLAVNELAAAEDAPAREAIVLAPPPLQLAAEDSVPTPPSRDVAQPAREAARDGLTPIPASLPRETPTPATSDTVLGFVSPSRRAVEASPRPAARNADQIAAAAAAPRRSSSDSMSDVDALAASLANSVAAGLSATRNIDVDPASIGPGTRLVQLGAYDDAGAARAAWDTLAQRFSPLLDDRSRVIEAAHSGGSVFYRLRAHGFDDERDARRFCAVLMDQSVDCIPVLIR